MLNRIEEEAQRLVVHDSQTRKRTDADIARNQQDLISQFYKRIERFVGITPKELERARQEHNTRFAPLEVALTGIADTVITLRDKYYYVSPNGSKPTIVKVHHYNEPYREGGANLYSASLVFVDPNKTSDQEEHRYSLAVIVSAYAHQNVPTKTFIPFGLFRPSQTNVVPGRLAYRVVAERRAIWHVKEPISQEFLERYKRPTDDLVVVTPEHDLFQQTDHGIEFSSLPADHLDLRTLGKYLSGNEFDPNTGFLLYEGRTLEHQLAQIIASKIPPNIVAPRHLYGSEITGQPA